MFPSDGDPDPAAPGDFAVRQAAIRDAQRAAGEIEAVVAERDAERAREVAGTTAQARDGKAVCLGGSTAPAGSSDAHEAGTVERLERADQHGGGRSFRLR